MVKLIYIPRGDKIMKIKGTVINKKRIKRVMNLPDPLRRKILKHMLGLVRERIEKRGGDKIDDRKKRKYIGRILENKHRNQL